MLQNDNNDSNNKDNDDQNMKVSFHAPSTPIIKTTTSHAITTITHWYNNRKRKTTIHMTPIWATATTTSTTPLSEPKSHC